MNDTELYRQILGIESPWYVTSVELKLADEALYVHLAYDDRTAQWQCPRCSVVCDVYDHRDQRIWRHLDSCQLKTYITASLPRVSCKEHGVHTVKVPWADPSSRFTRLFERFAISVLLATQVQRKAAQLIRLSSGQVHDIMHRAVSRGMNLRSDYEQIFHLTLDEKSYKRGHEYVSVLADPDGKRIIDIADKRTSKVAAELIADSLTVPQRKAVKSVTMDMWEAFMLAVAEKLPEADIVHDRFHIAKYLNKAVDDTRRDENRELTKQKDDTLRKSKYLWLRAPEKMTEKQRQAFEKLKGLEIDTPKVWSFKESFREFFMCKTVLEAQTFFYTWYEAALILENKHLTKVAQMLNRHIDGLLAYVKHKVTNASAEGINSLIQQVNSNAKGFRQFDNFRIAVLFFLGKLELYPHESS